MSYNCTYTIRFNISEDAISRLDIPDYELCGVGGDQLEYIVDIDVDDPHESSGRAEGVAYERLANDYPGILQSDIMPPTSVTW